MSGRGAGIFWTHAGLAAGVAAVGVALAFVLPRAAESTRAALIGVGLAAMTGAVGLGLKWRALRRGKDLTAALKVVGLVFGLRALCVGVGLWWVVDRGLGAVAFVVGFFGTYFVLQWIEVSYVMAASREAAGGGE